MDKSYDIIFVGAGISAAYTLIHLLNSLNSPAKVNSKLNILVIEKDKEFWTGLPYGNRSGKDALIITPLKEFIHRDETALFLSWLQRNFDNCFESKSTRRGKLLAAWLKKNAALIKAGNWQDLHIPRYWFGLFIKERVNCLLISAANKGYISYSLLNASVSDVRKEKAFYEVVLESSSTYYGKKVILSIGSAPAKFVNIASFDKSVKPRQLFINHIYGESLPDTLRSITKTLNDGCDRLKNVLIIGSNASAIELIYHLDDKNLNRLDKLYVISSSGIFPGRINNKPVKSPFVPPNLVALGESEEFTADQIFQCFIKDLKLADNLTIDREDSYTSVNSTILKLVNELKPDEQLRFVLHYGDKIGTYYRRAGSDYFDKVQLLEQHKKIEFIKGNFEKASEFGFEYKTPATECKVYIDSKLDIIINCTGSNTLNKYSPTSGLIKNLINRKICKINPSEKGFRVNNNFEADTNFYIMGPLLAGNIVGKHKIWHAESCKRIYELTFDLEKHLLK
ncbi:FAD/NAD(P)-binding protein [Mucilaginibacter agri]|uniref:FAD-dependent urate hydroxylase HpyO/Asp monooxygenase CreE-like FAD/NAD(P)-binding domain-containing protein n=1 Tax=Mucilaginibacter agri TaxID=2695265 RepID=A0A965ZFU5_9SPHI|nr:FAD/NAD(P)-binding protein [Mucilaginibacter agri]NCD70155.1 hypothetical protein [Mucilaginibacter agri]